MFYWRDGGAGVSRAVTDRCGGAGTAPFDSLNLAGHVDDDPAAVATNRQRVADEIGLPRSRLLFMNQCHGDAVVVVDGPWAGDTPSCDGLVTAARRLALAVLVADCVPVLLADPQAGVVGAVHAGRNGMTSPIVDHALDAMADLGARRIEALVGPSVCGRCYEVPEDLRAQVAASVPLSATVSWTGTPAVDVASGVVDQLASRGVGVTWLPGCTREHPDLFSYRTEARTGRFAAIVWLDEAGDLGALTSGALT